MKVRHIKTRLIARRLAQLLATTPKFVSNDDGKTFQKIKDIEVLPRTEHEYPIGRKSISAAELLSRDIEVIPDPDAAEPMVEVVRKKDGFSMGKFVKSAAMAMIEKAKAQKKASLMIAA